MSLRTIAASGLAVAGLLLGPAVAAQAAAPAQLTGTQLASRLLPASYFPSGYKIVKAASFNTGSRLEHAPARFHLATFSCKTFMLKGLPGSGFGETAAAGRTVANQRVATAYQQAVLQFASSSQASTFYRQLYAFIARCRTVTAPFNHGTARLTTQSLTKTHLGKLRAFRAKQTFTAPGLAVVGDTLVTVSGRDVYFIEAAGVKKAPSKPTLPAAALRLIARVRA